LTLPLLDKLDKIGEDGVKKEMIEKELGGSDRRSSLFQFRTITEEKIEN
jgi:hypothetical protein